MHRTSAVDDVFDSIWNISVASYIGLIVFLALVAAALLYVGVSNSIRIAVKVARSEYRMWLLIAFALLLIAAILSAAFAASGIFGAAVLLFCLFLLVMDFVVPDGTVTAHAKLLDPWVPST